MIHDDAPVTRTEKPARARRPVRCLRDCEPGERVLVAGRALWVLFFLGRGREVAFVHEHRDGHIRGQERIDAGTPCEVMR